MPDKKGLTGEFTWLKGGGDFTYQKVKAEKRRARLLLTGKHSWTQTGGVASL